MRDFQAKVYRSKKLVTVIGFDRDIEVGRCDPRGGDPPPVHLAEVASGLRLIIADQHQVSIPRKWFAVVPHEDGTFTVSNIHRAESIQTQAHGEIRVGQTKQFDTEILIDCRNEVALRIVPARAEAPTLNEYQSLASRPSVPGSSDVVTNALTMGTFDSHPTQDIIKMLRLALQVVQQTAISDDFFQSAIKAAAEIANLDRTFILLKDNPDRPNSSPPSNTRYGEWCVASEHGLTVTLGKDRPVSTSLLAQVDDSCTTVFHHPKQIRATLEKLKTQIDAPSLIEVPCAVASPILDRQRNVIGALYGDRLSVQHDRSLAINEMEASLVEILAGAVAGGIARREQERLRGSLAGFFSPTMADLLAHQPELMDGQDAEVTVLFCDIRGFSTVTEKLGPKKSIQWINDVMSELSQCVIDLDGVLVDYVGDELLAMWGAPGSQPDHASRAIHAARAILDAIEILRERWVDVLPQQFGAGIGINTGPARVGNVGSVQKFKYGPLGNTVNLGSRLQSATKKIGVSCIAGGDTIRSAGLERDSRRLCKIAVVGIKQPVDVYEIVQKPDDNWRSLKEQYESSLLDFENRRFGEAARRIGSILAEHGDDRPSHKLMARTATELEQPTQPFSAIWTLQNK